MADKSLFDKKRIEQQAQVETSGLLEQLNLPPALISFVRRNRRAIWTVTGVVVAVVVVVSLYGSYRDYRIAKGVAALDAALQAPKASQADLLRKVAADFSSTPASTWARIRLAELTVAGGKTEAALKELAQVDAALADKNPLKPLVIYRQAVLAEQLNRLEDAAGLYRRLLAYKGYEIDSHYNLGRVKAARGDAAGAGTEFQQFLSLSAEKKGAAASDPRRTRAEYLIKELAAQAATPEPGQKDDADHQQS